MNPEYLMRKYHYGYKHSIDLLTDPFVIALLKENKHQKQVINHLSRVIQNKNKKYRRLQAKKMPPTMYGREVVVVPDSMMDKIAVVNKDFFDFNFDIGSDIK